MVTCIFGDVKWLGTRNDLSVDAMCLMDCINRMKQEDKDIYENLTQDIHELVKTDDEAKECVINFIENLHDIL